MPRNKDTKKYLSKDSNAHKTYSYLLKKGYHPHVASGIIGNLMQESGMYLDTKASGDNGSSYGVAQWHKTRKDALHKFAKKNRKDVNNLYTQLDFLDYELSGDYARVKEKLQSSSTVDDAAQIFSDDFEKPNKKYAMNDKRRSNGRKVFESMSGLPLADFTNPVTNEPIEVTPQEMYKREYWKAQELTMNKGYRQDYELPFMHNEVNPMTGMGSDPRTVNDMFNQYQHMANLELKSQEEQEKLLRENEAAAKIQEKKNQRDFIMSVVDQDLVDIVEYDYSPKA